MSPTKNFEPHWLQILPHQCPVANPLFYLYALMVHASYFIHRHWQLIMPAVHVLMKYKRGVAVSNCLYWYSLSVLFERTVHKSVAKQYAKVQII